MKRREKMLPSSSSITRRESSIPVVVNHKNIGCMSGIFHLVSKYQHRRKLLTSSSEKEDRSIKNNSSSECVSNPKSSETKLLVLEKTLSPSPPPPPSLSDSDFKRFSFDVPRSPTIPSEIRISNSKKSLNVDSSSSNLQRSPALVARLMGLDDFPTSPSSSSSEKRRKLMVALEKCDEDLKALKNIIDTIRSTNNSTEITPVGAKSNEVKISQSGGANNKFDDEVVVKDRSSSEKKKKNEILIMRKKLLFGANGDDMNGGDFMMKNKTCSDINCNEEQQPSPVSVLDQISSPPPSHHHHHHRGSSPSSLLQQGEKYKKLREEGNSFSIFQRITFEALPTLSTRRLSSSSLSLGNGFRSTTTITNKSSSLSSSSFQDDVCKKIKVESVNEVCLDAVWAERWELGRIGVILEDYLFNELVEESVRELLSLGGCCSYYYSSSSSLPYQACRKKLCF